MEAAHSYLLDILALLLATIVVIPFFHAIRLGAILGYLTAGVILGPWGLGVINEVEQIRHLGEFGVVFLLFVLGIELKPEKLWQMRRLVLGLGSGQLFISAAVIYGVALMFGLSHQTSIIIGFGLALSSTAFCLKLLAEKGGIVTPMGQKAFSILLMQDLAVVPLLALVSFFAGDAATGGHGHGEFNLWYAIGVVIALLLAGRYLLNPVLSRIVASQDPEVFIAVAVFLVLGVAWLMEFVGLSMALGAFLAGLMLAESHYRHQIEADIMPFRGILLGLFFMTVGMGIDFGLLIDNIVSIFVLTIGLMVVKAAIVFGLTKLIGAKTDMAIQTGVLLSQSGEFGFVMFGAASAAGLLDQFTSQMLVLIITLSMVFTPFVVKGTNILLLKFYKPQIDDDDQAVKEFVDNSDGHVIIAGFGRVGARIAALLNAAGILYVALDMREERVKKAREQGFPVFFGDASQLKVLQSAGISRAKMLVVALDNTEQVDRLVPLVNQYEPNLPIYARAKDRKHCADLISQGATSTVSESLETSMHLAQHALLASDFSEQDVENLLNEFRNDYYEHVVQKVAEHQVVMGELRH
jgi:monovalent cation:proton antiporter-2 (CPA2) family protein